MQEKILETKKSDMEKKTKPGDVSGKAEKKTTFAEPSRASSYIS